MTEQQPLPDRDGQSLGPAEFNVDIAALLVADIPQTLLVSPSAPARPGPRPEPAAARPADDTPGLKLGGVVPFSATDYPGRLSLVVFVQGCPWRCAYCHNPHLQVRGDASATQWPAVMERLRRRVGLIDAVVFSGGEPTIDPALQAAMREVRGLGFSVGLHTAGAYPARLAQVLDLVDWVGLDIKASARGYDAITGATDSARNAFASAQMLLDSGVACEVRTTIHPALHGEPEILQLAQTLSGMGVRQYALQLFRATGCADPSLPSVAGDFPGADLLERIAALFTTFTLRRE